MSDVVKNIQINITSDTSSAEKSIDSIKTKLEGLKGLTSKSNSINFNISQKTVENLKAITGIDANKISAIATSLNALASVGKIPSIPDSLVSGLYGLHDAIGSVSKEDVSTLHGIATSLRNLNKIQSVNKKISLGLTSKTISDLGSLANVDASAISKVGHALSGFSSIGKVTKIPQSFAQSLADIGVASEYISQESAENITRIGNALQSMSGLKAPKIPDSFAEAIRTVAETAGSLSAEEVSNIANLGQALSGFNGIDVRGIAALSKTSGNIKAPDLQVAEEAETITKNIKFRTEFDKSAFTEISELFDKMFPNFDSKFQSSVVDPAKNAASKIAEPFRTAAGAISWIFQGVFTDAVTSLSSITGTVASVASSIVEPFRNAVDVIAWIFEGLPVSVENASKSTAVKIPSFILQAIGILASRVPAALVPICSAIYSAFSAAFSGVVTVAKTSATLIGSALSGIKTIAYKSLSGLGKIGGTAFSALYGKVSGFKKSFDKLILSIGRVAFYRAIRTAIRAITTAFSEGTKNIYAYSQAAGTALAPSLDSISSSMMQMKNAIGSAVAPLINALAPAVNYVIGVITTLIDRLAQLFALLGGSSTYSKAIATQYSFGQSIGETGKSAGGAAKQMKNFTTGIDELNVLDDSSGSGGGGGAGGYDATTAFEEATASFGQGLVDMIQNGKWNEAGTMIAEKINTAFEQIDFAKLGRSIGEKIQNALEFASGFLKNLDTFSMGEGIATLLNNAFESIDFNLAGDVWVEKYNRLIDLISGFAQNADWAMFGTKIGEFINGAFENFDAAELATGLSALASGVFEMLAKAIEEIHWEEIGPKINEFLKNVDWDGIVSSFFELLGAAFGAAGSLIGGIIETIAEEWQKMWEDILGPYIDENGTMTVEGFFNGIVDALSNVGQWIVDNIFTPFIDGFKAAFGIASPSKEMETQGGFIIDGLWEGIKSAWHNITDFFEQKLGDVKAKIKSKWEDMKTDASTKWGEIKGKISDKWDEIKEKTVTYTSDLKKEISEKWETIKTETSEKWEAVKSKIKDKFDEIKNNTSISTDTISKEISKKWDSIKKDTSEKWEEVKKSIKKTWTDIYGNAFEKALSIYNTVKGKWDSIKNDTKTAWDNVKKYFTDAWDGMKTGIKTPINNILEFVEKFANGVIDAVNKVIAAINSFASVNFEIPEFLQDDFDGAKEFSIGIHLNPLEHVSIPRLENGGFTDADLFYANENGNPELVGRIGNRTAVANQGQIIEGIASGVTLANGGVESLLEELIGVVQGKNFNVTIGSKEIGQANEEYQRKRGLYVNRGVFANAY